jgi:transposase
MSTDARARWYLNIEVEVPDGERRNGAAVGIDLGLKDLAALSNGDKIEMPAFYRRFEAKLAVLQRRLPVAHD